MSWLAVSTVGQFVVIALLAVTVLSLARQIGILHERTGIASLVNKRLALDIGDVLPEMAIPTLAGEQITLGLAVSGWVALLFLAADCPICRSVLPAYQKCLNDAPTIQGYWVVDGMQLAATEEYSRSHGIAGEALLVSQELGLRFGIARLPAIAVLDADSRLVLQRGVNGPKHVVRLFRELEIPGS